MELYEAMSTLRAVRRLRPDPVPEAVLQRLLQAATWAPTGGNVQPWRVVVVREAAPKQRLASLYARHWSAYAEQHRGLLASAPEPVRERSEAMIRAGDHLASHFAELPVLLVFCFDPGSMAITDADLGRPSVVGGASLYPAVQNLLLACRNEGLGCVLTTLLCRSEAEIRKLLAIPDPWYTGAVVPVGYPVGAGHGPLRRRSVAKMAYAERWGSPFPELDSRGSS